MRVTRRHLLQQIGATAAVAGSVPSLLDAAAAGRIEGFGGASRNGPVRLNRNESAYGPSPRAVGAIQENAADLANRFPDVESADLRDRLAAMHRVLPEQIVIGCGSSDILRRAAAALAAPGKKVITAIPTFDLMGRCAGRCGAEVIAVPLTHSHAHDLDGMLASADAATTLVYICNPNNPTGTLTGRRELESFIRQLPPTATVLIDEAYHHYVGGSADYASFLDRPIEATRLIVTRTFSHIHGLAGLRIGYAVASGQTAAMLGAGGLPEDVGTIAVAAALAAIQDSDHVALSARRNADARQEFFNQANARMVRAIDSQTNFVMLNTDRPAGHIVEHFRTHDVLVAGPIPSYDNYIRVSLGSPDAMNEFWRVWDLLPGGGHRM
ncbi:MAG TPA: histidinol-phosphate transaminase [Micromonosporaceae bacterium]|jgi:histidinol-phosphate aminotransferase|nr:histidinol-phosphate transaminase [Micromonosporaceae bacterium]